jgi:3-methyladenine DNA glycosylase AlkD
MRALASPARATAARRFFKTGPGEYGAGDRFLGLTVPAVRKLSREHETLPLRDVARLLKSPWHEERLLALFVLVRRYVRAEPAARGQIYRLYMSNRAFVNNWDLVDCSAEHIVGPYLERSGRVTLVRLAKSDQLWDRRIAVLATFHDIKRGRFGPTLRLARLLLDDSHDLMHKAVGWMLREIGKRDRVVLERFLSQHAAEMPRTMLRYAIERFPEPLRKQYLEGSVNARKRVGPKARST